MLKINGTDYPTVGPIHYSTKFVPPYRGNKGEAPYIEATIILPANITAAAIHALTNATLEFHHADFGTITGTNMFFEGIAQVTGDLLPVRFCGDVAVTADA
jgi:hypothetical protein